MDVQGSAMVALRFVVSKHRDTMAKKNKTSSVSHGSSRRVWPYVLWAVVMGAWGLLAAALLTYHPADWPGYAVAPMNGQPHNWAGRAGAVLSHHAYLMFGPGVWIALAGAMVFIVATLIKRPLSQPVLRVVGILLMALSTSSLLAVMMPQVSSRPEGSGGLVAIFLASELAYRFNTLGTMLILGIGFWIGAILAMDQVVLTVARWLGQGVFALTQMKWPKPVLVGSLGGRREQPSVLSPVTNLQRQQVAKPTVQVQDDDDALDDIEDPDRASATMVVDEDEDEAIEKAPGELVARDDDDDDDTEDDDADGHDAPGAYVAEKKQLTVDDLRAKIKQLPINFVNPTKAGPTAVREIDVSGYQFPGLDLLVDGESNFTKEMESLVRDQALQLEEALQEYRIEGEVVGIHSGPVITLYEIKLKPGTKVSVLQGVSSDLARSLKAQNIRIVPNTAGKDTVGIEVPNLKKEKVRLKDLMSANSEMINRMKLPMLLGKDASGNALIADLTEMPHMLIAGTTGSGKSVCMNSIIMSFMYTKKPDELRMVLVDPKMVEMSMFRDIPHLMCPVVTEMSKAAAILEWAVNKMDERYELLAEASVRDVAGYNTLTWAEIKERFQPSTEQEEAVIPKKLPYIVIIIDELADLMMTNKEVEGLIVRLAQKARAVGIHLILATQRPQANVVTGLIKGNMPCRVSFKVASGLDSRIVLDQKGAELLLGQGDMLYLSPRNSKLTRSQGTLVDDLEIRRVVKFLKEVAQQNFEPQLVQLRSAATGEEGAEDFEKDPLFEDAVRIVLETKRGSVSLLQRRLTIGYSRASRLIEQMALAGLLGEYKGSQAREVTISLEDWEAMREQAEKDAAEAAAGTVFDPRNSDKGENADKTDKAQGQPRLRLTGRHEDAVDEDDEGVPDEMPGEHRY